MRKRGHGPKLSYVGESASTPGPSAPLRDGPTQLPLWISLVALLLSITTLVLHVREQIERDSGVQQTVRDAEAPPASYSPLPPDQTYQRDENLYGAKLYSSLDTKFFINGSEVHPGRC